MENGPELILRFQKELKAIQVSWTHSGNGLSFCSPEKFMALEHLDQEPTSPQYPQNDKGTSHWPLDQEPTG